MSNVSALPNVSPLSTPPRLRSVGAHETTVYQLPEGAVVAAWPQAALPALQELPEQFAGIANTPMVGYLVLVPAGASLGGPGLEVVAQVPAPVSVAQLAQAAAPVQVPAAPSAPTSPSTPLPLRVSGESGAPGLGIQLDVERRIARVDGEQLELTYLEFELLVHLTAHPHRVHTRDHLVTAVWGYGHIGDGRTVDVHVARLRRKLGAEYRKRIVTVRRVGYKYVPPKRV